MVSKIFQVILAIAILAVIIGIAIYLLQNPTSPTVPTTSTSIVSEQKKAEIPSCPDVIKIGLSVPLSGRYSYEGNHYLAGVLAIVNWFNDRGGISCGDKKAKIELVYRDVESKSELATAYTESLIQNGVKLLLNPYGSDLTLAVAPIVEKYGAIMVAAGAVSDRIYTQGFKNIIGVSTPASLYFKSSLDAVLSQDKSIKRIAILYRDAEFNRAAAEGIRKYAESLGLEIVAYEVYPSQPKDLTTILLKVAQAEPDLIIGASHVADGQLLASQIAAMKINAKAFIISGTATAVQSITALGRYAECLLSPSNWELGVRYSPSVAAQRGIEWFGPTKEEFITYFNNTYPKLVGKFEPPTQYSAWGAEALLVLLYGISKSSSTDPALIRATLSRAHFMTFFGEFKMDNATGLNTAHQMIVIQLQKSKGVVVWPPDAAESSLVYPHPGWSAIEKGSLCGS